jgi:hypothetical protein
VLTTPTLANDWATLTLRRRGRAGDLIAAVATSGAADPWDVGPHFVTVPGAALVKATVQRQIVATMAVQALTAGTMVVGVEYGLGAEPMIKGLRTWVGACEPVARKASWRSHKLTCPVTAAVPGSFQRLFLCRRGRTLKHARSARASERAERSNLERLGESPGGRHSAPTESKNRERSRRQGRLEA